MADTAKKDCIQIVTYIRRRGEINQEQFYEYWENVHAPKVVPWAEKHGLRRYQQIHVTGSMVPIAANASAPNTLSTGDLPTIPIDFDGIAMFLVPPLKQFTDAFQDPYYIEVIEPNERELLDKAGLGSGTVASFQGKMIDMIHQGQSTVGNKENSEEYQRFF